MDQFIFAKRLAATWHFELPQLWCGEAHHPQVSKGPQFEILPDLNLGPHDLWSLNMRYLVKDALQSSSLIRCRCVDGREYRRWRHGNAAEPRQCRACRNQNGLWKCP